MKGFSETLHERGLPLTRESLQTLQVNLGRLCNQACRHCHVDAAPWRTEMMNRETALRVADWVAKFRPLVVDLTGGAPELNPNFRFLVQSAREIGAKVIDRNNLTILEEPGFEDLADFLAAWKVEIIASLPCYAKENVAKQRGNGVFEKSISALRKLNALGYGKTLPLHLVYNPVGAMLPPPQAALEVDYKEVLGREYGIIFNSLLTITNQPIARFADDLRARNQFDEYLTLLMREFNPRTVSGLMCRTTLSVGYRGEIYDCDFNQMLDMRIRNGRALFLWDITPDELRSKEIATGSHCFACTAGSGSSCTGSLSPS